MPTTQHYNTKDLAARREQERQVTLRLCHRDVRFVTDFVSNSGFYVEKLEENIGEDIAEFWETREHALRVLTDWMLQSMDQTVHNVYSY